MTPLENAVSTNSRDLLVYLQRRMGHAEDAADALGDVLVVVWRRRASLPPEPLEARLWLFGIAAKTLQNHRRSHRRRLDATSRLRNEILVMTPPARIESHDALDVHAAVEALPGRERELVRLIHWDGFSIAEAARITHVNESTARSRYATARTRLRNALDATEDLASDHQSRSAAPEPSMNTLRRIEQHLS